MLQRESLSCAPTQSEQHIQGNTLLLFCLFMNHSLSYTTSVVIAAAYLCLEFGGGAELKEELHNVIVTLLGGEEESSRACLEGVIKIDTAVSYSERNNFLCLYDTQKRMGGKKIKPLIVAFIFLKIRFSRLKYHTENVQASE